MNIKIEGNRIRTTSSYDVRMLRALNNLEGMKRWGANRSFSVENSNYNIEVWRSIFPDCEIENESSATAENMVADGLFDLGGDRPSFEYKTAPREHQKTALEKLQNLDAFGLFSCTSNITFV